MELVTGLDGVQSCLVAVLSGRESVVSPGYQLPTDLTHVPPGRLVSRSVMLKQSHAKSDELGQSGHILSH